MAETFRKLKELATETGAAPDSVTQAYRMFLEQGTLGAPKESARTQARARAVARRRRRRRGAPARPGGGRREGGRQMSDDFLLERLATARPRPATLPGAGVGPRPAYREEAPFKIHGGCGLMGICDESGGAHAGRGGGARHGHPARPRQRPRRRLRRLRHLPEFPDHFCFHLMLHDERAREEVEADPRALVRRRPGRAHPHHATSRRRGSAAAVALLPAAGPPALETLEIGARGPRRPHRDADQRARGRRLRGVLRARTWGPSRASGTPRTSPHFYRLDEYEAHTWLGHDRFPTNTPGWWGGAHPFTLLDWVDRAQRRDLLATGSTSATWRCSATSARCAPTPR